MTRRRRRHRCPPGRAVRRRVAASPAGAGAPTASRIDRENPGADRHPDENRDQNRSLRPKREPHTTSLPRRRIAARSAMRSRWSRNRRRGGASALLERAERDRRRARPDRGRHRENEHELERPAPAEIRRHRFHLHTIRAMLVPRRTGGAKFMSRLRMGGVRGVRRALRESRTVTFGDARSRIRCRRMRVDLFDYALPADRIAQEARPRGLAAPARARSGERLDRAPALHGPAGPAAPRRPARAQRRPRPSAPGSTDATARGASSRSSSLADRGSTDADGRWLCLAKPGRRAKAGPTHLASGGRDRPTSRRSATTASRVVRLRPRPRRRAPRADRPHAPAALHPPGARRPGSARGPRRRTRRCSRASRSPSRRRPRASTSPPEILAALSRAGRRDRRPDARRRRRHLQAGHRGRHGGARDGGGGGRDPAGDAARRWPRARARGAPRRRGRHDGRALARGRGASCAASLAPRRPALLDGPLHHAGLRVPRRRRAADELPPAALDAPDAGVAPSPAASACWRPTRRRCARDTSSIRSATRC